MKKTSDPGLAFLIIEKDPEIRNNLFLALQLGFYSKIRLYRAGNTDEGLHLLKVHHPDIVFIDYTSPNSNVDLISKIRSQSPAFIYVLANGIGREEKLGLYGMGADDIFHQPLEMDIFIAKIRNCVQRLGKSDNEIYFRSANLYINSAEYCVEVSGEPVTLTPLQYSILVYLARNAGKVVSYDEIFRDVWGDVYAGSIECLRNEVLHLRKVIEPGKSAPQILVNIYGTGYKLKKI